LADLGEKGLKIAASEDSFERGCPSARPLIVALEGEEALFKFGQRKKSVGCEDFPLYD